MNVDDAETSTGLLLVLRSWLSWLLKLPCNLRLTPVSTSMFPKGFSLFLRGIFLNNEFCELFENFTHANSIF